MKLPIGTNVTRCPTDMPCTRGACCGSQPQEHLPKHGSRGTWALLLDALPVRRRLEAVTTATRYAEPRVNAVVAVLRARGARSTGSDPAC
jgi:hypothetical protein